MKVLEILIVGLVFMALFPLLSNTFFNTAWYVSTIGNNATYTNATGIPYPALYNAIFGIVPLLVVVGMLYLIWTKSYHKGTGVKGI